MQLLLPAMVATLIAAASISAGTAAGTPAESAGTTGSPTVVSAGTRGDLAAAGPRSVAPARTITAGIGVTGDPAAPPLNSAGASAPRDRAFGWPLSPRPAVERRFEQPRDRWSPGHRGVDLRTAVGQPVLSAGAGVVAFSGVIANRGVITIRHPGGLRTSYEPVDERLSPGTRVLRGDRIGLVGSASGHCVPLTCLHWGAISYQAYRDPLSLLGFARPILLPLG
jgi:murein DD-endopeptidase MepM/ murein hydrolase activator NlpD